MLQLLAQTRDFIPGKEVVSQTTCQVDIGPIKIGCTTGEAVTIKGFEAIFYNVIAIALALAGITLFIMLLNGGFKYLTAGDNADQATAARQTLTYGLLGFILIVAGFLILKLIEQFTGVQVSIFKVTHN